MRLGGSVGVNNSYFGGANFDTNNNAEFEHEINFAQSPEWVAGNSPKSQFAFSRWSLQLLGAALISFYIMQTPTNNDLRQQFQKICLTHFSELLEYKSPYELGQAIAFLNNAFIHSKENLSEDKENLHTVLILLHRLSCMTSDMQKLDMDIDSLQ